MKSKARPLFTILLTTCAVTIVSRSQARHRDKGGLSDVTFSGIRSIVQIRVHAHKVSDAEIQIIHFVLKLGRLEQK